MACPGSNPPAQRPTELTEPTDWMALPNPSRYSVFVDFPTLHNKTNIQQFRNIIQRRTVHCNDVGILAGFNHQARRVKW